MDRGVSYASIATPISLPTNTPEQSVKNCFLAKSITNEQYNQFQYTNERGEDMVYPVCVYGIVTDKFPTSNGKGIIYNLFPLNEPAIFIIVISNDLAKYEANVGQCIIFIGYKWDLDGGNGFFAVKALGLAELLYSQEIDNVIAQQIFLTCK